MSDKRPEALTDGEWVELHRHPAIRELWAMHDEHCATVEDWKSVVYAVRFDFMSGSPGYCGDVFILQGDHLTGAAPIVVTRNQDRSLSITSWDGEATSW